MKDNKQVIRSKSKIADSLIYLLEENVFEDITIQEICYDANIARKTYYNHFSSKEDVLLYKLGLLANNYLKHVNRQGEVSLETLSYTYFEFAYMNIDLLNQLVKNNLFHILLKAYDMHINDILSYVPKNNSIPSADTSEYVQYIGLFYSGGLWHILEKWIEKGCDKTPEEISQIYLKIVKHLH